MNQAGFNASQPVRVRRINTISTKGIGRYMRASGGHLPQMPEMPANVFSRSDQLCS
jgi:hypothetical protein